MSPKQPPPRPGSSPRLNITEEVSPNAFREYREPTFGERDTPAAPHPPAPPAAERRPRVSNPPPPGSVRVPTPPPLPVAAPRRSQTLVGMPAPPSEPPARAEHGDDGNWEDDSVVKAVKSASSLAVELGARARELRAAEEARQAAEREAADLRNQLRELAEASKARASMRARWEKLGLKIAGGVTTVFVAVCGYVAWRIYQIEHKAETADAHALAEKAAIDGLPARVAKLEEYARADKALDDCQKSYIRSFAKRTSGYDITTLPDSTVVHWGSEGTKPNLSWFPYEGCLSPGSTGPKPPGSVP